MTVHLALRSTRVSASVASPLPADGKCLLCRGLATVRKAGRDEAAPTCSGRWGYPRNVVEGLAGVDHVLKKGLLTSCEESVIRTSPSQKIARHSATVSSPNGVSCDLGPGSGVGVDSPEWQGRALLDWGHFGSGAGSFATRHAFMRHLSKEDRRRLTVFVCAKPVTPFDNW